MSKGILYVASGDQFVREACVSANRVADVMPEIQIALVTDVPTVDVGKKSFDYVIESQNTKKGFANQIINLKKTPFDQTLCVDTDIYMDDPVDTVFELLDEFDIAASQNHDGSAYEISDVPDAFPEYNTGVVAYRMSDEFESFLNLWERHYEELSSPENTQNQPAFRKALYKSNLRVATLPSEYNTMLRYPGHAHGKVKMFHGRLLDIDSPGAGKYTDVPEAARLINSTEQHRTWTLLGGLTLHTDKQDSPIHKFRMRSQQHGVVEASRRALSKIRDQIVERSN